MRKSGFNTEIVRHDEDVVCDRCGKSCVVHRHKFHDGGIEGGKEIITAETAVFSASWGYWSDNDGDSWLAEVCEECAKKIFEFIDGGEGPGVNVDISFGDLTYYGLEGAQKKLERLCQENLGMSAEEFLPYVERGEVPEGIPGSSLSPVLHFAKFYLKYKDIPQEEWFTAHLGDYNG